MYIDGYPFRFYRPHHGSKKYLLKYLIQRYRVCYFCNNPVIQVVPKNGEQPPPYMATIEHMKPRPERKKGEACLKVLCCIKCNWERNNNYIRRTRKPS